MPASKSVTELTQVAARAIADKFGTEMIAIDLSDQLEKNLHAVKVPTNGSCWIIPI
jgi:hypothetical protein